jgi:uncharacterized protein YkwD
MTDAGARDGVRHPPAFDAGDGKSLQIFSHAGEYACFPDLDENSLGCVKKRPTQGTAARSPRHRVAADAISVNDSREFGINDAATIAESHPRRHRDRGTALPVLLFAPGKPFIDRNAEVRVQDRLASLCNSARANLGVPALQGDLRLQQVAQAHAEAMARGAYLDHVDRQGRAVGERLMAAGFVYRWAGENISAGKDNIDDVFHWWMSSAGHRANILKPEYTLTGAGYAFVRDDVRVFHHYWVQVFATPMQFP